MVSLATDNTITVRHNPDSSVWYHENLNHLIKPITNGVNLEDSILNKVMKLLGKKPIIEYKCHNCGGQVALEESKHIFVCPYCNSVYAVGTKMINDKGI